MYIILLISEIVMSNGGLVFEISQKIRSEYYVDAEEEYSPLKEILLYCFSASNLVA